MDFGALPPEINSGRMYAGPGSASMLAAAKAWDGLAAELGSVASSYGSVISGLTSGPWLGPTAMSMAAASAPYVAWMSATAAQAEQAATQAKAAAGAYHAAFAMTVPPPVVAANRAQLASLVATNFLGQNTPAIAATEAHYGEMWAQDAAAMYNYAGDSAAASALTPFTTPPPTTDPAGVASQAAAVTHAAEASAGTSQASLSQLITGLLQSFASPGTGSGLLGGSSTASSTIGPLGPIDGGSLLQQMIGQYAFLPGFFGLFMAINAIAPLLNTGISNAIMPTPAWAEDAEGAVAWDDGAATWDDGGYGAWGGLGDAASVGELSVPSSWGWATAEPLEALAPAGVPMMLGAAPLELPALDVGAGAAPPVFFGGLPRAAGMGAAAGAGAAAGKYGSRVSVLARSPAAGYPAASETPSTPEYPVPAGYPPNGHAPPGYRAAIVYLPTNGHAPATV